MCLRPRPLVPPLPHPGRAKSTAAAARTALARTAAATSLLLTGLAAGCATLPAVGPDYQPPALTLPDTWQTPAPPATPDQRLADWWRQWRDPVLDRLVDQALSDNLDIKQAQARLRQARASRAQAVSAFYPTLTATTEVSRSQGGSTGSGQATLAATGQGSASQTLYDAGFDASWEIDLFGGSRRAVEAATADLATRQAQIDDARVSLVAEVAENYVDLRAYQRRLIIARDNLASQEETARLTEWRYQAGLADAGDAEQARTNREQTRAALPDLEIGRQQAAYRLTVLLGQPPGALAALLTPVQPLPRPPAGIDSGIPARILTQRPDLIAAERTLAAETARVGQKLAQRFPSLTLSGSLGWQALSLGALGGPGSLVHSLGASLATTLFDGGKLRQAVAIQDAVQEQALISYRSSVLTALEEVENALTALAAAQQRIVARTAAAQSAGTAASLIRRHYESGLSDFQKVLDSERTRLTAEDNLALAEATALTSLIKLYKALGGGWPQPSGAADTDP